MRDLRSHIESITVMTHSCHTRIVYILLLTLVRILKIVAISYVLFHSNVDLSFFVRILAFTLSLLNIEILDILFHTSSRTPHHIPAQRLLALSRGNLSGTCFSTFLRTPHKVHTPRPYTMKDFSPIF
jgi:hypothetical protein